MKNRVKLVLAIRALNIGGAERQFLELAKKIDRDKFEVLIITLYKGDLDTEISKYLSFNANKSGRWDFNSLLTMRQRIRAFNPDAIYTFMPDMNITLAILKLIGLGKCKLIWGQFGSEPDFSAYGKIRKRVYEAQQKLEFLSDALISDGSRGIDFLKKFKHKLNLSTVIVSGTDVMRFDRNDSNRMGFRQEYNLGDADIAVGISSRLDPMKGYHVLARAAKRVLGKYQNVTFFSIGYGDDAIREAAKKHLAEFSDRFIWLGKQTEPEAIMSGWDMYCSSSLYGEGFSNSIIEAMACSLPIIATDVGDAATQVDEIGVLLKSGDDIALFNALDYWISSGKYKEIGKASRQRALEHFSSRLMAKRTEDFILKVLAEEV
jgi:glycosyltransferase involved in cell wall biosynthesis